MHFGRYPQRNAILGRASTPQELAFIASGDVTPTPLATSIELREGDPGALR